MTTSNQTPTECPFCGLPPPVECPHCAQKARDILNAEFIEELEDLLEKGHFGTVAEMLRDWREELGGGVR